MKANPVSVFLVVTTLVLVTFCVVSVAAQSSAPAWVNHAMAPGIGLTILCAIGAISTCFLNHKCNGRR